MKFLLVKKKTNIKIITIDTNVQKDNWYIITSINLKKSRKKKRIIAGSIVYEENTKTLKKI